MKKKLIYKYKEITKLIPVNNIIFKKNYTGFTFRKHLIIHGYKRFFFLIIVCMFLKVHMRIITMMKNNTYFQTNSPLLYMKNIIVRPDSL